MNGRRSLKFWFIAFQRLPASWVRKLEKSENRKRIVRESEVGVCVDVEVAKSLVVWLQDKIRAVEDAKKNLEDAKTIVKPDESVQ